MCAYFKIKDFSTIKAKYYSKGCRINVDIGVEKEYLQKF